MCYISYITLPINSTFPLPYIPPSLLPPPSPLPPSLPSPSPIRTCFESWNTTLIRTARALISVAKSERKVLPSSYLPVCPWFMWRELYINPALRVVIIIIQK